MSIASSPAKRLAPSALFETFTMSLRSSISKAQLSTPRKPDVPFDVSEHNSEDEGEGEDPEEDITWNPFAVIRTRPSTPVTPSTSSTSLADSTEDILEQAEAAFRRAWTPASTPALSCNRDAAEAEDASIDGQDISYLDFSSDTSSIIFLSSEEEGREPMGLYLAFPSPTDSDSIPLSQTASIVGEKFGRDVKRERVMSEGLVRVKSIWGRIASGISSWKVVQ